MKNEHALLGLINQAHRAASGDLHWSDFLISLNRFVGGEFANLEVVELKSKQYLDLQSSTEIEANDVYLEHYNAINPRIRHLMVPNVAKVACDHQMFSEKDMDRDEFYCDFLAPRKLRYFAGISAIHTANMFAGFSVQISPDQGHLSESMLRDLKTLQPHLETAVSNYLTFGNITRQLGSYDTVLDQFDDGVLLLSSDGKVLTTNHKARQLLSQSNISITRGRLRFKDLDQQSIFNRFVKRNMGFNHISAHQAVRLILRRTDMDLPFHGTLIRISSDSKLEFSSNVAVAFIIRDPLKASKSIEEILIQHFNLTHSEAALTNLLVNGYTLKQAAERRLVRYSTVRTQLKAAMSKLGVRRQVDLIRLVLSIR